MSNPTYPTNEEGNAPVGTDYVENASTPGVGDEGVARGAEPGRPPDPETPPAHTIPPKTSKSKQKKLTKEGTRLASFTPQQRVLILDSWVRSGLPATEYAPLVGVSHHTLYSWKKRFDEYGPAGLDNTVKKVPTGSRLPDSTQRAILMMKETHPEWGSDRIHFMLMRTEGYMASPGAILRVLKEGGYETVEEPTRKHEPKVTRFERAHPNDLWQTDIFTFLLKRENRRVHLVGFLDDHSRYLVGWGLHASSSGAMVRETVSSAIANYGAPEELLTDQGSQYYTWRGKSAFSKLLEKRGIRHIVARPRHPKTLGKIERFWGTLWRECVETSIYQGLDDARTRIGHFIDYYNFQRVHQGIEGLVPADRYFAAAEEVRKNLEARVAQNAQDLAIHGEPRKTFYLTGRVGDEGISLHGEGNRVILTKEGGGREEVDLAATGKRQPLSKPAVVADVAGSVPPRKTPAPGTSPLDEALESVRQGFRDEESAP